MAWPWPHRGLAPHAATGAGTTCAGVSGASQCKLTTIGAMLPSIASAAAQRSVPLRQLLGVINTWPPNHARRWLCACRRLPPRPDWAWRLGGRDRASLDQRARLAGRAAQRRQDLPRYRVDALRAGMIMTKASSMRRGQLRPSRSRSWTCMIPRGLASRTAASSMMKTEVARVQKAQRLKRGRRTTVHAQVRGCQVEGKANIQPLEIAWQMAIGNHAGQFACGVDDAGNTGTAARNCRHHGAQRAIFRDQRHAVGTQCDLADRGQFQADPAFGMASADRRAGFAPHVNDGHGQRITQRELHRSLCRTRDIDSYGRQSCAPANWAQRRDCPKIPPIQYLSEISQRIKTTNQRYSVFLEPSVKAASLTVGFCTARYVSPCALASERVAPRL